MTMDDGYHDGMISDEDFRAKFCAICAMHKLSFKELCRRAGVSQDAATRAIEMGTYGLPATQQVLQPLVSVVGLDMSYLLSGPAEACQSLDAQRLELFELVYEFALRNEIPRTHRPSLIRAVMRKLDNVPANSLRLAARVGLPRTMADIGYLYDQLLHRGDLA